MDLALVLLLVGVALMLLTSYSGVGIFLIVAAVILVVWSGFSGRGTFYRPRR